MENFGLPLIPENFSPGSRLKDDNHTRPLPAYFQHYSLPSTNTFNDADILRHACGSLYVRPVIPISLEKVLKSAACTKSDKIKISAGGIKNIPEKTASEYSKDPARLSPIKNSKQLELTAGKRSHRQEMMEKEENLENISEELRSHNTDTDSIQSAGSSPIRSILHMSSQKSNVRKKVQFPAEWPRVIALEHRLLIDDLSSV